MSSVLSGIRGKLLVLAVLPLIGTAISTTITFNKADKMSSTVQSLTTNTIPTIQAMGEIRKARNAGRQWFWSAMIHHENEATRLSHTDKALTEFDLLLKEFAKYETTPFEDFEKNEYPDVKAMLPEYNQVFQKIAAHIKQGTPESLAAATQLMDGRFLEIGLKISTYCEKVNSYYNQLATTDSRATSEANSNLKSANIWTSAISSIILFIITLITSEVIIRKVSSISAQLLKTGQGVRESIEQLSHAGASLSQSSTSAAASLEETVASLEQMSSMVKMNSDNAKTAANLSLTSYRAAEKGEQEIHKLIGSMQEISSSSKKIEEIINVIDDIAFQTNLLALNAAVEAARAGEQGKGFAVVAEAVRSLAQRSASAAKDISGLIQESVRKVEVGTKIADESETALTEILTSAKKVADLNNEIAEASSQQATGIAQINKAMTDLDQSSQNNAASAEEIAATSTEIKNQAEVVESEVIQLNSFVMGQKTNQVAA